MFCLMLLSFLSVTVILMKLIALRERRVVPHKVQKAMSGAQEYIDKDNVTGSGETDALEGVYAEIHQDWAWEIALSATGEPGAVKSVIGSTGETSAKGVDASGSKESNTIEIIASKNIVGSDIGQYKYILILGSQDGFGTGKWRDVDEASKSWRLGGGHDLAADGYNYDSNILDMVLPEDIDQQALLSSYSIDNKEYVQLTGFDIPSVEQQIYGISTGVVTGNTALVQWSTTQAANSSVRYSANNTQTWNVVICIHFYYHMISYGNTLSNIDFVDHSII